MQNWKGRCTNALCGIESTELKGTVQASLWAYLKVLDLVLARGVPWILILDQFVILYDLPTLVYRIDMQYEINVQVGKFLKKIKRAGQNRRAGWNFFLKINKYADQNKTVQGEIFSQNLFF